MSKKERKPVYGTSDIGKETEGGFTIIDLHPGSGGAIGMKKMPVKNVEVKVRDAEFLVLLGAMGAPICEVWIEVKLTYPDYWGDDDGDDRVEVNLLHMEDGVVKEFMAYEPVEEGGHMGVAASSHFRENQEDRLKFLTRFGFIEADFDELNPPWEYAC